jgi:hypothetical protein
MLQAAAGVAFVLLLAWVFVIGLRAMRTKKLAMIGMVPAGCSLGAFAWSLFAPEVDLAMRVATGTAAIAAGVAHGVWFSLVPLPPRRVWLRIVLVPIGMWFGTFASLWFVLPYQGNTLKVFVAVLGSATLTAWALLPFLARNRGFVDSGSHKLPSVRFPCPRCGTRVDWGLGIAACTDCGLFLHIFWPADELQKHATAGVSPPRSVRFACPSCGVNAEWQCGDGACASCGLKLTLHWNVHKGPG